MARHKYIRIKCNGRKARSTGNEKWYRELVLKNDYGVYPWDENPDTNNYDQYLDRYMFLVMNSYPDCWNTPVPKIYTFTVEVIKSNNGRKRVTDEFILPFYIKKEIDEDSGILIFRLRDFNNYTLDESSFVIFKKKEE